ncbi:hypothetical protein QO239_28640, partial [Cupriavidus taiwanensis]|uniref:hypothetical protein n=1 Tax=Cupriavidus taiwanensis TaxID=164546 RepID=UPI0025419DD7
MLKLLVNGRLIMRLSAARHNANVRQLAAAARSVAILFNPRGSTAPSRYDGLAGNSSALVERPVVARALRRALVVLARR